ncbi:MAG: hypothetical protein ACM3VS_12105, partial [Candidatus Dadabacteria bacterium]
GVNDFQTGTFSENIIATYPGAQTPIATLTYAVPLSTTAGAYDEKYIGDITVPNFGTVQIQLKASGTNPIILDYVRLVPVP